VIDSRAVSRCRWPGAALLAALGCAGLFATGRLVPPGFHDNLLANPGFEAGDEGWTYPVESENWGHFEVAESPVHTGRRAARLRLRAGPEDQAKAVWVLGVMQEVRPQRFPDVIGGFYRVEAWEKSDPRTQLYLQAVAIIWSDEAGVVINRGRPSSSGIQNYQLRFYLAGVSEPPFRLGNAMFDFVSREPPRLGEWTYFEIPLREQFQRLWGLVPERYDRLRVLFEAHWDGRPPGSTVVADAYFDDLFLGYVDAAPGS